MKFLEKILSSFQGHFQSRITDPFLGAFIFSWLLFNWKPIALLFWGNGKPYERIEEFSSSLSNTPFYKSFSLLWWPLLLTLGYLLVFPWISLFIKHLQERITKMQHKQAVELDVAKAKQQEDLNRAKLLANPDKKFLEQSTQIELDKKAEVLKQSQQKTALYTKKAVEADYKATEAARLAEEAETKRATAQLEYEKKSQQSDIERKRFEIESAKTRAELASHRFPSVYMFIKAIEESVRLDGIILSATATGEMVAAIFGYKNFTALLADQAFSNETFSNVKYVYYESNELAKRLEVIVANEESENEDLTSDLLFDHINTVFDDLPYKLVTDDHLSEIALEQTQDDCYDLLNDEGTSEAIAESNTIYEEVMIDEVTNSELNDQYEATLIGSASGTHYKESDVPGIGMSIQVKVASPVLIGKYGLGELERTDVSGGLNHYWETDEELGNFEGVSDTEF